RAGGEGLRCRRPHPRRAGRSRHRHRRHAQRGAVEHDMTKPGRPGARKGGKKGATTGTGGNRRKAREDKGPTPTAEDRSWDVAGKRRAAQDRLEAARVRHGKGGAAPAKRAPRPKKADDSELVTGRNSVVEALRARIPATTLYIAANADMDDRVKES